MSKPRPVFDEMPWQIKQNILDSTDFKTRCRLRKCSKSLRNLVDQTAWNIYCLKIHVYKKKAILSYQMTVEGRAKELRYLKRSRRMDNDHIERAIIDFLIMLKNKKTYVRYLYVIDTRGAKYRNTMSKDMTFLDRFCREMSKIPHKLNVVWLKIDLELNQHEQLRILSYFSLQKIETINLKALNSEQDMSRVIASEYWRKAYTLCLENLSNIPPISSLMGMKVVDIELMVLTAEILKTIVQEISTSTIFEFLTITSPKIAPDFMPYMNNFERRNQNSYLVKFPNRSFDLVISFAEIGIRFNKARKAALVN